MSLLDNLRHKAIEESHDESVDVRTIDIGVGHDDNLVITQFVDISLLVALALNAKAHSDALDDVHHRLALEHLVPHHLLHVEDLSSQRKDGLGVSVATLFCRTTGGVSLDEEDFTFLRVLVGAVGQFTGESATRHRVLALNALSCLTGCNTCSGSQYHLVAYLLSLLWVLLKIVGKSFAHSLLYSTCHLGVTEFGLCLSLKLRFCHLDGDDSSETLTEVLTGNLYLCLLNLLGYNRVGISIFLQCACESHTESHEVCTALDGVDVVHV